MGFGVGQSGADTQREVGAPEKTRRYVMFHVSLARCMKERHPSQGESGIDGCGRTGEMDDVRWDSTTITSYVDMVS
jgi:hypothetical protein